MQKPFSLLIKPAGADCNLRCHYCFYLGRKELYPETQIHRMSEATLTRLVRSYLAQPFSVHTFAFQGGEPLLMGESFYRQLVTLQKRYARPGSIITNCVQTNATLVTPTLAKFFAEQSVLVGLSIDGPAEVHNLRRPDAAGQGSHAAVIRGLNLLLEAGGNVNCLTLVSQSNVHQPLEIYHYLRDTLGLKYLQFIECVEFDDHGGKLPDAITPDEWANFVCTIFEEWVQHDVHTVSIRLFDAIVSKMLTGEPHNCSMAKSCGAYFVVEHTGDVYPCDFFVRPELKLGNIHENDWDEIQSSSLAQTFNARKSAYHADCKTCAYLTYCQGDCPKNRTGHDASKDAHTRSYMCEAWKKIYAYVLPKLTQLAQEMKRKS